MRPMVGPDTQINLMRQWSKEQPCGSARAAFFAFDGVESVVERIPSMILALTNYSDAPYPITDSID
jgi:hypothetical protein